MATTTVFSEFELREMAVKFNGETSASYIHMDCVGECEEEMEVRVVTKKCRGKVKKTRVKGTGTGTLKLSAHVPYNIFTKAFGMENAKTIDGVMSYGENSTHPTFSIVQHVYDEDDNEKFKAYPNCTIKTGVARKIENGAEEVAEVEMEISVDPDDYGNGLYEALASDLQDNTAKSTWMTAFIPDLVKKTAEA